MGARARIVGVGARGDGGAGKDLQTQIKDVRGFEGAGWTFVEAAARRLLGGLHGHRERVSRRAPATYGVARLPSCLLVSY